MNDFIIAHLFAGVGLTFVVFGVTRKIDSASVFMGIYYTTVAVLWAIGIGR